MNVNATIRQKLLELADLIRESEFPTTERYEVNDAKAIGVALAKAFTPDNLACMAYHGMYASKMKDGVDKAKFLSESWEKTFQVIITNGYQPVPKVKGMYVDVLQRTDRIDCTLGGITSRRKEVLLIGEGVPQIFEAKSEDEIVVLQNRQVFGSTYQFVKPYRQAIMEEHTMMGGNFVYSSDSRFPSKQPLPVHDRIEPNGEIQEVVQA